MFIPKTEKILVYQHALASRWQRLLNPATTAQSHFLLIRIR